MQVQNFVEHALRQSRITLTSSGTALLRKNSGFQYGDLVELPGQPGDSTVPHPAMKKFSGECQQVTSLIEMLPKLGIAT